MNDTMIKNATSSGIPLDQFYRPTKLKNIIGQPLAVQTLETVLSKKSKKHAFLFVGPPGSGKTSSARVIANELGCHQSALVELDAAAHGAIDTIRDLMDKMKLMPQQGKVRVLILDEIHEIHKKTWSALLKSLETPPPHAYYILCTTEENAVPATIASRCVKTTLNPVPLMELAAYGALIAQKEKIIIPQAGMVELAKAANGNVRQMLVYVEQCSGLNLEQIQQVVQCGTLSETNPVISIARMLVGGAGTNDWVQLMDYASHIIEWGGVKPSLRTYTSKCLMKAPNKRLLIMLDSIEKMPEFLDNRNGMASLQLFLGRVLMS